MRENSLTMKRTGAVESDSVKSSRKAKDKCETHKYNHMHCCAEGLALQCLSCWSVSYALKFYCC